MTDHISNGHRADAHRDRAQARAILNRARDEQRESTPDELIEVQELLERSAESVEQIHELHRAAPPVTIMPTPTPRTDVAVEAAEAHSFGGLELSRSALIDALDRLMVRETVRQPLVRAALPAGGTLTGTGPADRTLPPQYPNRLFDVIQTRGRVGSWSDTFTSAGGQAAGEIVAPGAAKPIAAVLTVGGLQRQKLAAYVEFLWESTLQPDDLRNLLGDVLVPSLIQAENAAVVTAVDPVAMPIAYVDSPASSILSGVAAVNTWGGAGAIVLNPADIVSVVGQTTATTGAYMVAGDPTTAVLSLWGVPLYFSTEVVAGVGYVIDPRAVVAYISGPPELIVSWVNVRSNIAGAAVDEHVGVGVTRNTAAAKVDLTVATATATRRSS